MRPPFCFLNLLEEEMTMAEVTAANVKELRERTGLGMMECKKALVEADGDIETAIDNLRKSGQAKAAKKAGNIAAEGAIIAAVDGDTAIILEVNSQTDFVARDDNFTAFANKVAKAALTARETDVAKIAELTIDGQTVEEARVALVQKIGENIQVRRAQLVKGPVLSTYIHGIKIGVVVAMEGGNEELARDIAMHIAAAKPEAIAPENVSPAVIAKEREIAEAKAAESGKPANIVEKMVEGAVKKFLSEVSLVEQAFIKDTEIKVGQLLTKNSAKVVQFVRLEVGEGIEKKEVDFAAEVAAAVAAK
jgi:elongation factor Ts